MHNELVLQEFTDNLECLSVAEIGNSSDELQRDVLVVAHANFNRR